VAGIPSMPRVKRWTSVQGVLHEQSWFRSSTSIRFELEPEVPVTVPPASRFECLNGFAVPSEETLLRSG